MLGVVVAFAISSLTGVWFPRARLPIFFVISFIAWCAAWKYAAGMDRARKKWPLTDPSRQSTIGDRQSKMLVSDFGLRTTL